MRIGIDLGGTKIELIALGDAGEVLERCRIPTPAHEGYEAIVEATAQLVRSVEVRLGRRASVGVGTPGAISPATGLLRNSNTTCLNGMPLDRDLRQAMEREVRIANDADCFALSEATDGAGEDAKVVFGVIMGTGTGGGLVVGGQLLSGPNAIAGEWGHNPLPWPEEAELPGRACYCGKRGCIETWLSGPGLEADHAAQTGQTRTVPNIVALAQAGDASAHDTLERHADRTARALSSVINIVDPDAIVLGGGLSNLDHLYAAVESRWGRYVFSDVVRTRLLRAEHGDSSGVRGAAWLW